MNGNKMRRVAWILSFLLLMALVTVLCALPAGAEQTCTHYEYENGLCTHTDCDGTEIAPLNNGVYEISNAGHLYYVARLMESKADGDTITAKLMCNITVNEELLGGNGAPRTDARVWEAPGYAGTVTNVTFDGQGHYISGLYADYVDDDNDPGAGFFGRASNVQISNLGIENSYFSSMTGYAGGLIAYAEADCEITNCYVRDTATDGIRCGALVGVLYASTVQHCYTTMSEAFGYSDADSEIINCYYFDDTMADDGVEGTLPFDAELLVDAAGGEQRTLVQALSEDNVAWDISCHSDLPALRKHHVYAKACDTACSKCAQGERADAAPHVYADCVAMSCSVCGKERTGTFTHSVTAPCATTCMVCNAVITNPAPHTGYSYACDTTCVCGYEREAAHLYDPACESRCAYCNALRSDAAPHAFDNGCDPLCNNGCGMMRNVTHSYENACDGECNVCGKKRQTAHEFGEYVVTREATKLKNGEQQRACTKCGYTETVAVARYGVDTWVIAVSGVAAGLALCGGGFSLYWFVFKKRLRG